MEQELDEFVNGCAEGISNFVEKLVFGDSTPEGDYDEREDLFVAIEGMIRSLPVDQIPALERRLTNRALYFL